MGLSISWIAVKDTGKHATLERLGLIDTGSPDPGNRARLSCAELSDGWIVIFANDVNFASPERISQLSRGGMAVGCLIEDHVMFSGARCFRDGVELWWVLHDAQSGSLYDLTLGGDISPEFESIRRRFTHQQDEEGGEDAPVDVMFDVPVEFAAATCGFHGNGSTESQVPVFMALKATPRPLLSRLGALFGKG